jgi:hypothetical protein
MFILQLMNNNYIVFRQIFGYLNENFPAFYVIYYKIIILIQIFEYRMIPIITFEGMTLYVLVFHI